MYYRASCTCVQPQDSKGERKEVKLTGPSGVHAPTSSYLFDVVTDDECSGRCDELSAANCRCSLGH
eukprot:1517729-Amphidinium_carterae.1